MELVKKYAKAIWAFVIGIAINIVTSLVSNTAPWPETKEDWIRYVGGVVLAAIVLAVPNKQDQGQVTTSLQKLPDEEAKTAVNHAYPTWNIG